jgi:ribosomal protein S18 acetylase RimI-like enzyme
MYSRALIIRTFRPEDEAAVVGLWQECGLTRPWNDPHEDISRKTAHSPELFFVGTTGGAVIAAAMAGYDGHRGSVNYLAVHPDFRHFGYGRQLMSHIEDTLKAAGCPKINIQIRSDNPEAAGFYR